MKGFATSAQTQQAIILINKEKQKSPLGYNLANDLIPICHDAIKNNAVLLYTDATKTRPMSIFQLEALERLAGFGIKECKEVIVYETWELDGRNARFEPIGFQFGGINDSGQVFNFGFISANEMKPILENSIASTDARGFFPTSLWQLLSYKQYDFELLSFNNKTARNTKEGERALKKFITNRAVSSTVPKISRSKQVITELDVTNDTTASLILGLNAMMQDYIEDFLNLSSFHEAGFGNNCRLEKLQISEIWVQRQGKINYENLRLNFFFNNGVSVKNIQLDDLPKIPLLINDMPWGMIVSMRIGTPKLISINNEPIPVSKAGNYYKALYGDWLKFNQNL